MRYPTVLCDSSVGQFPDRTVSRLTQTPDGHIPDRTIPRLNTSPMETSPTRHFPTETFSRPDISPTITYFQIFVFLAKLFVEANGLI